MPGLPDVDLFPHYGGAVQNYLINVIDPVTDESADQRNLYVANVAAMTHTVWRAIRSFLGPTAGQTLISEPIDGFRHDAVWGDTPNVRPVGTYVSAGVVDFAWPTQITDALGVVHTLALTRARASCECGTKDLLGSPAYGRARANVIGPNKVRVYTYDQTLASANLVGIPITVWVR